MSSVLSLIHVFFINLHCCISFFTLYLPLSATISKTIGKIKQNILKLHVHVKGKKIKMMEKITKKVKKVKKLKKN